MRPDQLPTTGNSFNGENDYRPLLAKLEPNLHSVVHFRCPRYKQRDNEHYAIVVSKGGVCYVGRSRTNHKAGDRYNRKHGFRLAVKRAFENMFNGDASFDIGVDPPTGWALKQMVVARMDYHHLVQMTF